MYFVSTNRIHKETNCGGDDENGYEIDHVVNDASDGNGVGNDGSGVTSAVHDLVSDCDHSSDHSHDYSSDHEHLLAASHSSSPPPSEGMTLEQDVYASSHPPFPTTEIESRPSETKESYSPTSTHWKWNPPPESPRRAANQSAVFCKARSWCA